MIKTENALSDQTAEVNITNDISLQIAVKKFQNPPQSIVIEEYFPGTELRIFFTNQGWINILQKHLSYGTNSVGFGKSSKSSFQKDVYYIDVTKKYRKVLLPISKKVLKAFVSAPCISFRIILTEDQKEYVVTDVYQTFTPHYAFQAYQGKKTTKIPELIASNIEEKFTHYVAK